MVAFCRRFVRNSGSVLVLDRMDSIFTCYAIMVLRKAVKCVLPVTKGHCDWRCNKSHPCQTR